MRLDGDNEGGYRFAEVFFFDALFRGVKQKTPRLTLQEPPPQARSILLVMHAEAAPPGELATDMTRELTPKGMQDAEGLGVYLVSASLFPFLCNGSLTTIEYCRNYVRTEG